MKRLLLLIILIVQQTTAQAETSRITLAAPHWCPFSCDPVKSAGKNGILVDYLEHIFAKHQIALEVAILPWSRAIKGAQSGKYQGLVSAVTAEAPTLLYPDKATADYANCFFVNNQSKDWRYRGAASLQQIRLAYLQDYGYEKPILDYLKQPQNRHQTLEVSGANGVARMIRLLEVGRVDAFIEERWVAQWEIKRSPGLAREDLHQATCMPGTPFFTPINPNAPGAQKLIDILNEELSLAENQLVLEQLVKEYLQ